MVSSYNNLTKALIPIWLIALALACSTGQSENQAQDPDLIKRSDMSELSLLMRRMDKLTTEWKQALEAEEYSKIQIPDWLEQLHTAEATDPSEITDIYSPMADAWIESVKQFNHAPNSEKPAAFNTLVTNCVTCHQQFCQGPIPKIKKLYVDIPPHVSTIGN